MLIEGPIQRNWLVRKKISKTDMNKEMPLQGLQAISMFVGCCRRRKWCIE